MAVKECVDRIKVISKQGTTQRYGVVVEGTGMSLGERYSNWCGEDEPK